MFEPRFSLITVCFRRWHHFQATFKSWVEQTYPNIEMVVVADGRDEGIKSLTNNPEFSGQLLRMHNAPYYRASYMRNVGAMAAIGEYFGLVDADVYLHPEWVASCMKLLQKSADIVANTHTLSGEDAGGVTGSMAISRWLFEKLNGYNENLDNAWGYEDTDLLIRAQRAGGRVGAFPTEMLQHLKHEDRDRQQHFKDNRLAPRTPKLFVRHLLTCEKDAEVHPYEANRVRRLQFPPDQITKIVRE